MSQGKNAQVQKRGKSWQYRIQYFTEEGKRESVSRSGYATRKEAKEAGDKVASELSSNKIIPEVVKDNPSTKEFYEFWLESYCSSNVKESTRRGYVKNLKNLIYPYIKEIPLRELNAATLQNLLDILLEKGYALNRIRAVKGMFTGGLDFAVRMQLIAVNPAKSIRMPNVRKVMESSPESVPKERRPIAEWEWEVIIGRYPEGVSAHFPLICGYRLGNRLGETFGYTWDDVNWSRRSISVNRQVVDKVHTDENGCHWYIALPKYESMREIELDDATYELLLRMKLKWEKSKKWMQELWISYQKNIVEYELDRTQAFFCTLKDVLAIDMPSTEEEEREALEKIKHILKSLGEGSHCANAFKGCVELAEKNIEENAAFSFPDCLQKKDDKISEQSSQIEMLKGLIPGMKKPLDEAL